MRLLSTRARHFVEPAVLALVAAGLVAAAPAPARAATPCAPVVNPVACENSKPGTSPSIWDIPGSGDASIQGFATDISTNLGGTEQFKIDTDATSYRIDIYRLGYYGGLGARKIAAITPSASLPQRQPSCLTDSSTGLVDCGNWGVSASWTIPTDTVSGVFFAHLIRTDRTSGASHIPFVVRDDSGHSAVDVQTSDTTWQAYNTYGGNSLYVGSPAGRAYKVSYNRPITTRGTSAEDYVFNAEFPMIRFLEANGYDVSYTSGVDTDRNGALIKNHKVFMAVGHDEYWSGQQRANVEAARDAGVNLAFFSGNAVFWKTRWESSIDGSGRTYRTLVCYKETHANAKIDPQPVWTGSWRDPRFSPPYDGGRPENRMTGALFLVNGGPSRRDSIKVPAADGKMRFWRGTAVASQAAGATATMPAGTLGYEWDAQVDNGFRPPGLVPLSTATYAISGDYLLDYGSTFGNGTATNSQTLYKAPSGALVFSAGSVQWSWGLDATHDFSGTPTNASMRQATVNLLADMGAQPATLVSGLSAATASTDTTAPSSVITAPAAGASVAAGTTVTISGTATDTGGQVGGVEVSVDGGTTWHPATGRGSWTYTWRPTSTAAVTLRSRAADDSGNLETPSAGVPVNNGGGGGGTVTCPCTVFGSSAPASPADSDSASVELGVKLRASTSGSVTGIRFYKSSTNTGTHTGSLWSATGTRLATGTFTGETASGWQQLVFPTPVAITAGTTYVASYLAPNGHYNADDGYFTSGGVTNGPLTALQSGTDGPNGIYAYGAGGTFPTSSFNDANYWVDVTFTTGSSGGTDTTPPTVTSRTPAANATGVATTSAVSATFSEPVQSTGTAFTLTGPGGAVPATVALNSARTTVTLTPSSALAAGTTYTAALSGAKDAAGNTMAAVSWSFTTASTTTTTCPCSLWDTSTVPGTPSDPDTASVELGVRFTPSRAGSLTAVRFYKAGTNTGTHVVHVWSATGTLLATATATGETASGWQTVPLSSAVALTAGTTYVASYRAPVGHYAADNDYFTTSRTVGPLTAPATGNGVYTYGANGTFPSSTYQSSNYWVDVVFS
jgi:methionine-rich copper-binding protein CopC